MPRLYNTLSRKKETLKLGKTVKMYTCGPTVYDYAHVGNMRAYLFYDLLKRWLEYRGFDVKHVMNITDVDDKTIRKSIDEKRPLKEITKKYAEAFFDDVSGLRIKPANVYPCATEHIKDMVEMITKLLLKGYAYKGEDGSVYYDISKFKKYGKLSKLKIKKLKPGARVSHDEYSKKEVVDFALWKAWTADDGDVYWVTPLGKGRPGWHIECSAMSMKYLSDITIHGGGVDLIFPHHENEIAQSEAATGKRFVHYWVHCNHLLINGRKMSKSLNNFLTLRDVISKGYDPVAFRYLVLSSHYRSQLNFTFEALEDAASTVRKFNEFVQRVSWEQKSTTAAPNHDLHSAIKKARDDFEKYMDDDLDTPRALAAVFNLMRKANAAMDKKAADRRSLQAIEKFILQVNQILDVIELPKTDITQEEKSMIDEREEMRKQKRFTDADRIRDALKERGIVLEDTPQGVKWKREK